MIELVLAVIGGTVVIIAALLVALVLFAVFFDRWDTGYWFWDERVEAARHKLDKESGS